MDECNFMCVVCEGCGLRIYKQEQIKHESVDCRNPLAKCHFCERIFSLREMNNHQRSCSKRSIVKVEYVQNPVEQAYENTKLSLLEFDQRPDQEYIPSSSKAGSSEKRQSKKIQKEAKKSAPKILCTFCDQYVLAEKQESHQCFLIEKRIKEKIKTSQTEA